MKFGDITFKSQSDLLPVPYIGTFDRDVTTGSGTQSITGLGFKPSFIFLIGTIDGTDYASWGFSTVTQEDSIVHHGDTDNFDGGSPASIRFSDSVGSNDYTGDITSLDTDGFTVTWTLQSGSPTGTARLTFMAFK